MITKKKAENLLTAWANVGYRYTTFNEAFDRLASRYPDVFGTITSQAHHLNRMAIRERLRLAWDTPNQRHREWYLFLLRWDYHKMMVEANYEVGKEVPVSALNIQGPPEMTPFEAAIYHFQKISDRARHCANPNCHTPYFIASKRGQKYCSSPCARPAQREAKRAWWRRNRTKDGGEN